MVGLYYMIQQMGIFPMSIANNFCDMPLPKYHDLKTVLIYRSHPVCTVCSTYYFKDWLFCWWTIIVYTDDTVTPVPDRLNMEVDLQSLFGPNSRDVHCTAVFMPPALELVYEGAIG